MVELSLTPPQLMVHLRLLSVIYPDKLTCPRIYLLLLRCVQMGETKAFNKWMLRPKKWGLKKLT